MLVDRLIPSTTLRFFFIKVINLELIVNNLKDMLRTVRTVGKRCASNGFLRSTDKQLYLNTTLVFGQQRRPIVTESLLSITHVIQTSITGLQSVTGAPWWATIATSTVFARASLLPLVRTQIIASQKLSQAMPEIGFLYKLFAQRQNEIKTASTEKRLEVTSVFLKGVDACLKLYDVSKTKIIAYPMVNIAMFMTFIYSVRDMIANSENYDLLDGGMLWFVDLAAKDSTFILPFTAVSLSYLAIDLAINKNSPKMMIVLKDFCQSLMVMSVPFVVTLPAGVFCYWIPSSLFAIAQGQLLRSAVGQELLGIPAPKLPPHLQNPKKDETTM